MDFCHSCTLLGKEKQKYIEIIYISRVGKSRHWSSELKVLHKANVTDLTSSVRTHECIRVKLSLLALEILVTRHQTLLHQAGFLLPRHITMLSRKANKLKRCFIGPGYTKDCLPAYSFVLRARAMVLTGQRTLSDASGARQQCPRARQTAADNYVYRLSSAFQNRLQRAHQGTESDAQLPHSPGMPAAEKYIACL